MITRVPGQFVYERVSVGLLPTLVMPGNVTAGNLIVFTVVSWGTGASYLPEYTISTTGSATLGTWTIDIYALNPGGDNNSGYIYSVPILGTGSLSVSFTNSTYYTNGSLQEYSGVDTSETRVAGSNHTTGTTPTAPSTGSVTISGSGLFVAVSNANTDVTTTWVCTNGNFNELWNEPDGYSYVDGQALDYMSIGGATQNVIWSALDQTGPWHCLIIAYKASGSSPAPQGSFFQFFI